MAQDCPHLPGSLPTLLETRRSRPRPAAASQKEPKLDFNVPALKLDKIGECAGQDAEVSSTYNVKNTFIDSGSPLLESLDGFFSTRTIRSCPSNRAGVLTKCFEEQHCSLPQSPGMAMLVTTPTALDDLTPLAAISSRRPGDPSACCGESALAWLGPEDAAAADVRLVPDVGLGMHDPSPPAPTWEAARWASRGSEDIGRHVAQCTSVRPGVVVSPLSTMMDSMASPSTPRFAVPPPPEQAPVVPTMFPASFPFLEGPPPTLVRLAELVGVRPPGLEPALATTMAAGTYRAGCAAASASPLVYPAVRQLTVQGTASLAAPGALPVGPLMMPSVGSAGHEASPPTCKPCAFFHTKGCEMGTECEFCHLCGPEVRRQRRRMKIECRQAVRAMRRAPVIQMRMSQMDGLIALA